MIVLPLFRAFAEPAPGFSTGFTATAAALEDDAPLLSATAEAPVAPAEWLPLGGLWQSADIELYAAGELVERPVSLSVAASADSIPSFVATWPLRRDGLYPIGSPHSCGSATGLAPISAAGTYYTAAGELISRTVILANGVGFAAERAITAEGAMLTVTGGINDPGRRPVKYEVPIFSGRSRAMVIAELAALAGAPCVATSSGMLKKSIVLDRAPWWQVADELARLGGQKLYVRHDGTVATFPLRVSASEPVFCRISEGAALSSAGIQAPGIQDPVTSILASGARLRGTGEVGIVTTSETTVTYARRRPRVAYWQFAGGGLVVPTGATPPDEVEMVEQELYVETARILASPIREYSRTRGWLLPETWKHLKSDDGSPEPGDPVIDDYNVGAFFFTESAPAADDSSPAYLVPAEFFGVVAEKWIEYLYDDNLWLVGKRTYLKGWRFAEEAIKTSSSPKGIGEWPTIGLRAGCTTRGDGKGVAPGGDHARYTLGLSAPPFWLAPLGSSLLSYEEESYSVVDGFIRQTRRDVYGWARQLGSRAQFADGAISDSSQEQFLRTVTELTTYSAAGEGPYVERTFRRDYLADPGGSQLYPVKEEVKAGYLPAATRRADAVPNAANETDPISVRVVSEQLEACWPRREESRSYELAEDAAELEELARQDLDEAAAEYVTLSLAAFHPLRVGMVVFLDLPSLGITRRARVWEVAESIAAPPASGTGAEDVALVTRVVCRYSYTGDSP